MKSILEYIQEKLGIIDPDMPIIEMSTVEQAIKWGKDHYRIALHGPAAGDRPYPHIHIYLSNDSFPYNKFNFEVSLVDILCYDEINLILQQDKKKNLRISNRNKCSWEGYRKIRDGFEDWLLDKPSVPGEFIDNLDVLIHEYNKEAPYKGKNHNALLEYIKNQGKKVLPKYLKYFE